MLASFVSYTVEKKVSKHPEKFGYGAIEGVASPESANNAAAQSAFIPLLTLGLPSNTVTAVLLGALMIHGVIPGPALVSQNPDLFWGVIASMIIGNAMLLILNLPLIPLWVKVLRIPYSYLFPLILLFCVVGVYTVANNVADVIVMLVLGIIGYGLRKLRYEPAPLVLALVLGPMFERSIVEASKITYGNLWMLFTRPICLGLLFIAVLFLFVPYLIKFKQKAVDSGFKE
jgi:putative tricarboxylic transport membrane protein